MAKKRPIKVRKKEEDSEVSTEPELSDEIPDKYVDRGWKHWLQNTYAKVWYAVGCAFVDVIVPLEISRQVTGTLATSLPLLALAVLILVELYIFHWIWGGLEILFER